MLTLDRSWNTSSLSDANLEAARAFRDEPLPYAWADLERELLGRFVTNTNGRVAMMHNLPSNVMAAIIARFSRLKNKRGVRGCLIEFLVAFLEAAFALPDSKSKLLDDVVSTVGIEEVRRMTGLVSADPEFLQQFANAGRIKRLLDQFLTGYGHNSIARAGMVCVFFEQISVLAAERIVHGRTGSGYIELSTRFVDMGEKLCYPIARELALYGIESEEVESSNRLAFECYKRWTDPANPLQAALWDRFGDLFSNEFDSESATGHFQYGCFGDMCDLAGNFLPASTCTSVGVVVSGEAMQSLMKHLIGSGLSECIALAEGVITEAEKTGADQFIRHYTPTGLEADGMRLYLPCYFNGIPRQSGISAMLHEKYREGVIQDENRLARQLRLALEPEKKPCSLEELLQLRGCVGGKERGERRLTRPFELVHLAFDAQISFRTYRDIHRHVVTDCMERTVVTPDLGFFKDTKFRPDSDALNQDFQLVHEANQQLHERMKQQGVPLTLAQYPLALGNKIGFTAGWNLRQQSFMEMQRTKPDVHPEARSLVLSISEQLRKRYSWWESVSLADMTPHYLFARAKKDGKHFPLPTT